MRTVKRNPFLAGMLALAGGMLLAGSARAAVTTTNPAGLLIFPKLLVGTSEGEDTIVQLSNTSGGPVNVRCELVNANSHCSNIPEAICTTDLQCGGGACLPGWTETDFIFTLTSFQPIAWRVSTGLQEFPLDGLEHIAQDGEFNANSNIPNVPETPFTGEMKCFEVDSGDNPISANDLKGEVTTFIVQGGGGPGAFDVRKYNASGLQATGTNDGNDILCLGGTIPTDQCPTPEYAGCPNILILDHFFDGAPNPVQAGITVNTDLTLVPCSENFLDQSLIKITVQMLIFNEFEQRLSTSRRIQCLADFDTLSDIDTRLGPADDDTSIFNIAVEGTLTGQTRLRAVQTDDQTQGTGILGVATENYFRSGVFAASDAFDLDEAGERDQGDVIQAPRE